MSGLSDLAQNIGGSNLKSAKSSQNLLSGGLYGTTKVAQRLDLSHIKNDHQVLTGAQQKKGQLATATAENAAAEAANTAQIAADAAAAEKKRRAGIMPTADDAAMKADKRRRAASAASAGGRESTVLTGQRLGD